MRKIFGGLVLGSVFVLGCAGGIKDLEKGGTKLGNDVADSSVTKDVADAGTNVGNDVADSSVTKDVADAGAKVGNDVSGKKPDAGAPASTTKKKKK